ncbi:MAG: DUF47 family protein [Candidatus Heimdallarchaeota archaeon]|nr:DUF47 family protein [Candidatus Heimdallarchaeota archaeon]
MKIGKFLRRQAEGEIKEKMAEHLSRIHLATKALTRAIGAWRKHDLATLDTEVGYIAAEENAADRLLAEMWLELAKGNLKSKLRSNIITFIKRADEIAGFVKRAGENFLILHEIPIPNHIFDEIEKACEFIEMCAEKLVEALKLYKDDVRRTVDLTTEISFLEHQIDGLYSQLKNHYFDFQQFSDNFGTIVIFDHAIQDIERAANSAEDAGDVLRSMAIGEI